MRWYIRRSRMLRTSPSLVRAQLALARDAPRCYGKAFMFATSAAHPHRPPTSASVGARNSGPFARLPMRATMRELEQRPRRSPSKSVVPRELRMRKDVHFPSGRSICWIRAFEKEKAGSPSRASARLDTGVGGPVDAQLYAYRLTRALRSILERRVQKFARHPGSLVPVLFLPSTCRPRGARERLEARASPPTPRQPRAALGTRCPCSRGRAGPLAHPSMGRLSRREGEIGRAHV